MSASKKVVAKKVAVRPVKKADLPDVPDSDPIVSPSKGKKSEIVVAKKEPKEPKKAKEPKAPKAPKAPKEKKEKKVTRTGRMIELLLAQKYTDDEMYVMLDKEFGEGKDYLATLRKNLNTGYGYKKLMEEKGLAYIPRFVQNEKGVAVPYVKGEKKPKEDKGAKIKLALSKLPVSAKKEKK